MKYYLWDQADTIFTEVWDTERTGVADFRAYVKSLGNDPDSMSKKEYEFLYEVPYKEGLFKVDIMPGFIELLSWTKYNGAFTTGVPEQRDWRQVQLSKKYPNLVLKEFIPDVFSTFDYGDTNVKTIDMYADVLGKIYFRGFATVVYADDKLANCAMFEDAAHKVPGIEYRLYRMNPHTPQVMQNNAIMEVRNLFDILEAEKKLLI